MATITIARQMGSFGCRIANILSDVLGYKMVWRDLINQAALRIGAPEAALGAIDELGLLGICPTPEECEAYQNAVQEIMMELWDQGDVVIVGRAGQVILGDCADALHVRLVAASDIRAKRVAKRHNIRFECAQAQIIESDNFRKDYLRRFYGVDWSDPQLYHLVINTSKINPFSAAKLIENALPYFQADLPSPLLQDDCK